MLVAWLCLIVSAYIWAFRGVEPSPIGILNGILLFALGLAALFAGILLVLLACLDAFRISSFKDRFLAFSTLVLGFFLFDALQQLAIEGRAMFLEAFVTVLVGVLIALAVESNAFRKQS